MKSFGCKESRNRVSLHLGDQIQCEFLVLELFEMICYTLHNKRVFLWREPRLSEECFLNGFVGVFVNPLALMSTVVCYRLGQDK